MAEQSKIEWTDSTFNPWIGRTAISPACDHCYAEAMMDTRMGRVQWGAGQARSRTSAAYWKQPLRWNAERFVECGDCGYRGKPALAAVGEIRAGDEVCCCAACFSRRIGPARRRVFCASLADVFDNEVPAEWLVDLLDTIHRTSGLDWLVLTKRVGNVLSRVEAAIKRIEALPDWPDEGSASSHHLEPLRNWLADWVVLRKPPANIWLGATVCNQTEVNRDVPKLLAVPARVRFLSIEPMLGPIELPRHDQSMGPSYSPLDWIICGGESGPNARDNNFEACARDLMLQCRTAGVPFFGKQNVGKKALPEDLRVREFPEVRHG